MTVTEEMRKSIRADFSKAAAIQADAYIEGIEALDSCMPEDATEQMRNDAMAKVVAACVGALQKNSEAFAVEMHKQVNIISKEFSDGK
jgi:hypothetical protein